MVEILLKINGNDISVNGKTVSEKVDHEVTPIMNKNIVHKHNKRTYDDFIYNGTQYFRIGEIYGLILPNDELKLIARTTFYKNRKRVLNAIQ